MAHVATIRNLRDAEDEFGRRRRERGYGAAFGLVYGYLVRRANKRGECWPSASTIARACCLSVRTVWRAIAAFVIDGLISRTARRRPDGTLRSNLYQLHLGRPPEPTSDPPPPHEDPRAGRDGRTVRREEGGRAILRERKRAAELAGAKVVDESDPDSALAPPSSRSGPSTMREVLAAIRARLKPT